eukprot:jgi/Tetstr1/456513/TSEL_043235.t1
MRERRNGNHAPKEMLKAVPKRSVSLPAPVYRACSLLRCPADNSLLEASNARAATEPVFQAVHSDLQSCMRWT